MDNFTKSILALIALGIWVLVLQNMNIQKVKVVNSIDIGNEVEVDIRKINGWNAANSNSYTLDGEEYHSLGVAQ